MMQRPTVKVVKPRGRTVGDLILLVEGVDGQRMRIFVSGSSDMMHVFIEHDEETEMVEVNEVVAPRWPDR